MQATDEKAKTATFRAVSRDEEGRKHVEKVEVRGTRNVDTLKHVEKKLIDKGVQRQDRQPADGMPRGKQPKSGRGGKYTWEGPADIGENEMEAAPAAMDENDPNYVDEATGSAESAEPAADALGPVHVNPQLQRNV